PPKVTRRGTGGCKAEALACRNGRGHLLRTGAQGQGTGGAGMSISSTDPFWSTLSAYDTGALTGPAAGTGGATGAAAGLMSGPLAPDAEANNATLMEVLGSGVAAPPASAASSLMSDVLAGQSSAAVQAVGATIASSLLDTLL